MKIYAGTGEVHQSQSLTTKIQTGALRTLNATETRTSFEYVLLLRCGALSGYHQAPEKVNDVALLLALSSHSIHPSGILEQSWMSGVVFLLRDTR
jgi:hypothetical protein